MRPMKTIRIMLVDDHQIVRLGLRTLINDESDMEVIAEAGSSDEALLLAVSFQPDVILMDIRLPGESGIDATRKIITQIPTAKVIMLTSYTDDTLVIRAIRAGAVGYILKQVNNERLLDAIRTAARGEALLDPGVTAQLLTRIRLTEEKLEQNALKKLSRRELEVLEQVARGKTNQEIGHILNLQEKTVRNYVSNMLEKLNLTNRIALAVYGAQNGILNDTQSLNRN